LKLRKEKDVLNEFWWYVSQDTRYEVRMDWLQRVASTRVENRLDYVAQRKSFRRKRGDRIRRIKSTTVKCFACGERRIELMHHVVQAQHGGSNAKRNQVGLCDPCHREVHPWMKRLKPSGPAIPAVLGKPRLVAPSPKP
jgi:5-methylcytosine-specific restriction endonuclease McrA